MKLALIANLTVKEPTTLNNPIMHLIPNVMCAVILSEELPLAILKEEVETDYKRVNLNNRLNKSSNPFTYRGWENQ